MKVSDKKARLHFNRWSKSTKRTQNTGKKHFSYSSIMPYWNGTFKLMNDLPTIDGVSKVYIYSGVMSNTH